MSSMRKVLCFLVIVMVLIALCDGGKRSKSRRSRKKYKEYQLRETTPPNFVRLVIMRLIYGIASSFGMEERLSGFLGGIFVPPGAEDDDYGDFGGFGDFDVDGGGLADIL
ncbi:LOC117563466 [Sergentomyia squamirostris]